MRNGGALQADLAHVLLGSALTLADSLGNLAGLADAVADVALAVADDDQAANFMTRPPLTVLETRLMETTLVIMPSSSCLLCMAIVSSPSLQLQTGLAGTLSESLHTAVVNETAAVIDHFGNALLKALLGDVLANLLGSINVAP